jgi:hypothetical protein
MMVNDIQARTRTELRPELDIYVGNCILYSPRDTTFPTSVGIVPVIKLLARYRYFIFENWPTFELIVPVKKLESRMSSSKSTRLYSSSGSFPSNELRSIRKVTTMGIHKNGQEMECKNFSTSKTKINLF